MNASYFLCNYHNYNDDILPGISYFEDKAFFLLQASGKEYIVCLSHVFLCAQINEGNIRGGVGLYHVLTFSLAHTTHAVPHMPHLVTQRCL